VTFKVPAACEAGGAIDQTNNTCVLKPGDDYTYTFKSTSQPMHDQCGRKACRQTVSVCQRRVGLGWAMGIEPATS